MAQHMTIEPYPEILAHGQQAITTATAEAVPGTNTASTANDGRHVIMIRNLEAAGGATMYWGRANTVTTSTGYKLDPGEEIVLSLTSNQPVWIIHSKGSDANVCWAEFGP